MIGVHRSRPHAQVQRPCFTSSSWQTSLRLFISGCGGGGGDNNKESSLFFSLEQRWPCPVEGSIRRSKSYLGIAGRPRLFGHYGIFLLRDDDHVCNNDNNVVLPPSTSYFQCFGQRRSSLIRNRPLPHSKSALETKFITFAENFTGPKGDKFDFVDGSNVLDYVSLVQAAAHRLKKARFSRLTR